MKEILAVGFFDGVHLGHRALLEGATAAFTFLNHPSSVLSPGAAKTLLMDADSRIAAIKACGVRKVWAVPFTGAIASMPPEDFLSGTIEGFPLRAADIRLVRCGADWRFGRGAAGDAALLRRFGVETQCVPYVFWNGERISSSRIRASLAEGDVKAAEAMLGRPWTLGGKVVRGKGMGRGMGRPTVNVEPSFDAPLRRGAYVVEMCGERAVANFGVAPTFGEKAWRKPVLEVHFLSQGAELPGPSDRVEARFVRFIRPEMKFASPEALARRIAEDAAAASS